MQDHTHPMPVSDPWLVHAVQTIKSKYNDEVSVRATNKDLLKFGRNTLVGTVRAEVQTLPIGVLAETYVNSNLITSINSSDAGDTQKLIVEGHTSDDGLVFVTSRQEITLTGRTPVPLDPPLARASRTYNNNSSDLAGIIYVTEDDTYTAGIPDTASKVHLVIALGENQSEKAAFTVCGSEYFIVTTVYGDMLKKQAAFAEIVLQMRLPGKVFRTVVAVSCSDGNKGSHNFKPYFIAPKNADLRVVALADNVSTEISAGIQGVFAVIRRQE